MNHSIRTLLAACSAAFALLLGGCDREPIEAASRDLGTSKQSIYAARPRSTS